MSASRTPRRLRQPLRGRLYCAAQALRGRPLARFVRTLQQWERLPPDEFARMCEERLRRLLTLARERVPLYRSGAWGRALSAGEGLAGWPVLERDVLGARFGELHAEPGPGPLVTHRTSGSSGHPVRITMTRHADVWGWAHRYRALLWHGIPIGVRSLRLSHDRRPLRDFLLNHKSVPALGTPESFAAATRFLTRERPPLVAGPPSALFSLARHLREAGLDQPPAAFARVGGEQLFAFQRDAIEAALGARVVDSYGATEIGALAGECPAGAMHVYAEHVRLEIFHGDRPAPAEEFGDIVATALHNPAMPLVRYRVGDRGRLSREPCPCGLPHPVLRDLQARRLETFPAADGTERHGSELTGRLGGFFADSVSDGVRQLQFRQTDRLTWEAWIEACQGPGVAHDRSRYEPMRARLAGLVRETFGPECHTEIRVVPAIPRERGKFRYVRPGEAPAAEPLASRG